MTTNDVSVAWWVGEALQDTLSNQFGVTAGLGAGKTHGFCQWHHQRVRLNAKSRFSCFMEPSYQKIHDAAIPTYEKVIQKFGLVKGLDYKVIKSPYPKLVYLDSKVKHEVHFISAENPEKIVAVEYSHASADEMGIVVKEAANNLASRIRCSEAKVRQFMNGGAPQGINDFADKFDSDTQSGWDKTTRRDHTKSEIIDGVEIRKRRFTVHTEDNKANLPPAYIAELKSIYAYNSKMLFSYLYGLFCDFSEGQACSNYNTTKHDIADIEPDPHLDIYLTFDFNANPVAWGSLQCRDFYQYDKRLKKFVLIHEANENNGSLDEAVLEFAEKHPVEIFKNTPIYIYGDSSGHRASHKIIGSDYDVIRNYLRDLGYKRVEIRAMISNPLESQSIEAVQKVFLNDLLLLCKRCTMTKRSLIATKWKKGTRKLDKPAGETWTHHVDMLKYFVFTEMKSFTTEGASKKLHGFN